jgi:hypothetical protein
MENLIFFKLNFLTLNSFLLAQCLRRSNRHKGSGQWGQVAFKELRHYFTPLLVKELAAFSITHFFPVTVPLQLLVIIF